MADMLVCPLCGTENPPNQKVCQRCQTPLTSESSFKPGQSPVNKDTGELESVLPQWLRDARESAKQDEPTLDQPTIKRESPEPAQPASTLDFLAGLQSQDSDNDEEEIPDWLASITGSSTPKPADTSNSRRIETGHKEDFHQADSSAEEEVPSWLAGIQTPQFGAEEKDELTDWFRESGGEVSSFQASAPEQPAEFEPLSFEQPPSSSGDAPDWLKQMQAQANELEPEAPAEPASFGSSDWFSQPADSGFTSEPAQTPEPFVPSDNPDWLNQLQADADAASQAQAPAESFNLPSDAPDWLSQLQSDASAAPQAQTPEPFNISSETPDWLNQLQSDAGAAPEAQAPEPFNVSSETPDWLNQLQSDSVPQDQASEPSGGFSETPDWLNSLGGASAPFVEPTPAESEPFESAGEIPSWLSPESEPASKKVDSTPRWLQEEGGAEAATPAWLASNEKTIVTPPETPAGGDVFGDMPDWLKAAAPESSMFDEPAKTETPKQPFESAPAFEEDAFKSEGGDALFTEMPDWLSNAMETPPSAGIVPEPITGSDALAPNILPSWVEAMRPTDDSVGMANIVAAARDQTLESRGALAGLQGVLPAGVGFNPTSKPKAYSIKLNASAEQLKHAEILEQILAAETAPETITTEKKLVASRPLRWAIAFILLAVTFVVVFLRTQFFSMPLLPPNELKFAVAVAQAIPANAPVLVAVDYEPSRAGEMEAAAAPLFDNLLLLKQPRLTFVASNEAGSVLAERLVAGQVALHNEGVVYLNLGYLSGGQMGIRAFAQNPSRVAPVDINNQPAWTSATLQGVTGLDQFAAIILVTDSADAARIWIEQTQDVRGAVPVIVVSSAQASPMIQPYYDSGQVAGIVSGLYGGALFEQQNSGRPGTARAYWDAYSIGMLLAVAFVLGGGLINLFLGVRERSAMREAK